MKSFRIVIFSSILFLVTTATFSQKSLLQSGPMLGYSEMREVALWVQTKQTANVKIKYTNREDPSDSHFTNEVLTKKETAFTAKLLADSVEPGNVYTYQLYINDVKIELPYKTEFRTQDLWLSKGQLPDFRFVAGSCAYINEKKYDGVGANGGDYQIFESIARKSPDFMLWLGDNVYLREPDWNSWTGIVGRYTHDRAIPELQPLLGSTHHYAIWDDHDYGPNNSDRSFWNKTQTKKAFELFWANPSTGVDGAEGITTFFKWADIDFFLLDNRYNRSPNERKSGSKTILGKNQLEWLKDALAASNVTFKFVAMGGQFLNDAAQYEMYTSYGFEKERQEILDFIYQENIKGVIFLTGDRHHTELSYLPSKNNPDIYDVTISPFTSGPHTMADREVNSYRVDGTLVMKRNFGLFEINTENGKRVLTITDFDSDGNQNWKYKIQVN